MQIVKWDHKENKGIYKESIPVRSWKQIRNQATELVKWLNANNGSFKGAYKTAYAISHCQVEADPQAFFVVSEVFIGNKKSKQGRNVYKNYYFPSQIIVNARILSTPEKIMANKPERKVEEKNGEVSSTISIKETEVSNVIAVPEGCMSFPLKKEKTIKRFYRIKVQYQYPVYLFGFVFLKTRTEWCEAVKAHIFQHECEHLQAKNMHYSH
jgi:hypothetical protein